MKYVLNLVYLSLIISLLHSCAATIPYYADPATAGKKEMQQLESNLEIFLMA